MQGNNNFDTIISTWRRMSGEQTESVTVSMSGDSSDLHKKKDEEASLLVPERLKGPIATVASAGTAAAIAETPDTADLEEKLLKRDNGESNVFQKEAAGDATDKDLKNKEALASNPDDKKRSAEKVDSVCATQITIKVPPQPTTTIEAAGDANDKALENKDALASYPGEKMDKVDGATQTAIKVPPQSTPSTLEDEDCATKCLYYTLQCCDCILM